MRPQPDVHTAFTREEALEKAARFLTAENDEDGVLSTEDAEAIAATLREIASAPTAEPSQPPPASWDEKALEVARRFIPGKESQRLAKLQGSRPGSDAMGCAGRAEMRNELVAWSEMEHAEAREAAQEQEWEDSGLAKLLPEPIQAGKLRPFERVYTHDQLVAAMLAARKA